MKTMAALLRDPYPVHWDGDSDARLGPAGRVVNRPLRRVADPP